MSYRDIEDFLAEKGISVSYESIQFWCIKFETTYVSKIKEKRGSFDDILYLDVVFIMINGKQHYLLINHGDGLQIIITDKLASYKVVQRELMPIVHKNTAKYANNRAEQSHELTRFRERGMKRFKSPCHYQLYLASHVAVSNLYNFGRHLTSSRYYRRSRTAAFATRKSVVV